MRLIRAALGALVAILAVTAVSAQTGGIKVIVSDESGPLPGATVTITNELGYVKATSELTNPKGEVIFPVLRAGAGYAVEVKFPGYSGVKSAGLKVSIGDTLVLPIKLMPQMEEVVQVVAESEVLDLENTTQTTKFSDEFIQDLPVPGRSYQNLFTIAPGVQDDDGDGNVTVHGSRDRDFKPIVGGVSNVDPLTGQLFVDVNLNSIEEMEVITAGAGVEFGRAQGGFANIIQKQGSNTFEGLVDVFYNTSKLDGDGVATTREEFRTEFDNIKPGFQISGPIVRDKLWYRLTNNLELQEVPVNTGAGVFVQNFDRTVSQTQITWQASPRNKLAFSLDYQDSERDNIGVSTLRRPESTFLSESEFRGYKMQWTAPYSPKILVDTTIAYQDFSLLQGPSQPNAINNCIPDANTAGLQSASCTDAVSQTISGPTRTDYLDDRQRFSLNSKATIFGGRWLGMNHQIKMGLSVENERYKRDLALRPDLTVFRDTTDIENELNETQEIVLSARIPVPRFQQNTLTSTVWGFFLEDQITPISNLVITLGVRVDREQTRSEGFTVVNAENEFQNYASQVYPELYERGFTLANDENLTRFAAARTFTAYPRYEDLIPGIKAAVCDDDSGDCIGNFTLQGGPEWRSVAENFQGLDNITLTNTNVSPALAISWDPFSNGKWNIKASAGRKYNNIPLVVPLSELAPTEIRVVVNCEAGECDNIQGGGPNSNQVVPDVSAIDRDLGTPYQDEWTLTIERELTAETSIALEYINRKFKNQLQDIDVNHVPGDFGACVGSEQSAAELGAPDGFFVFPVSAQPFGGNGVLDNCIGDSEFEDTSSGEPGGGEEPPPGAGGGELGGGLVQSQVPDNFPDLYTQNPAWGDIFLIGNYNRAEYEGVTLRLNRRQYRGWQMTGSYTWSEARGNGEDFGQQLGDDRSLADDEVGYQANDRRHVVKFAATTITPWGFRFGTNVSWQSGLPYSILQSQFSSDALPPVLLGVGTPVARTRIRYPTGERNSERNRSVWNVDINFTKEMQLGNRMNLQLSLEVFNLLNDGTYSVYNPDLQLGRQINGANDGRRRFGRQFQLGAKLTF